MTEEREIVRIQKKKKQHYAGISVPDSGFVPGDRSAWNAMVERFKAESAVPTEADLQRDDVDIICTKCRNRVGFIKPLECRLPLRGSMIHRHLGCEAWHMPLPSHGPLDFICPHAWDGDMHLFIDVIEGQHEKASSFLTEDGTTFDVLDIVEPSYCLCGCGRKILVEGKEYSGLECWKKHMMEIHGETYDEPEEKTVGRICPCGCGGEVKENNKYADRLNCYRREQALIGKQAKREDGTRDS